MAERERKKNKSRQTLEKCGILKNIDLQISLMANRKKKQVEPQKNKMHANIFTFINVIDSKFQL